MTDSPVENTAKRSL